MIKRCIKSSNLFVYPRNGRNLAQNGKLQHEYEKETNGLNTNKGKLRIIS